MAPQQHLLLMQVVSGNQALGRTCATAIPVREKQGMLWLWPRPGAEPDEGSIPSGYLLLYELCHAAA